MSRTITENITHASTVIGTVTYEEYTSLTELRRVMNDDAIVSIVNNDTRYRAHLAKRAELARIKRSKQ